MEEIIPEHIYSDQWPERWNQTKEKWGAIVEKNKAKETLATETGWIGLEITHACGYCTEFFNSFGKCLNCPLNKQNYCVGIKKESRNNLFWDFFEEMEKTKPDFTKVLKLAEKMLERIMQDDPSKQKVCEVHGSIEHMQSVTGKCPDCNQS